MSSNFSVSLQGLAKAVAELDRAARRIARPVATADAEDTFEPGQGTARGLDYATELLSIRRARTAARANIEAIRLQSELVDDVLDRLGRG